MSMCGLSSDHVIEAQLNHAHKKIKKKVLLKHVH